MKNIGNQFCIFGDIGGVSLLIDEVTSCIVDEKIHGTVSVVMSVEHALQLGRALIAAAKSRSN